MQGAATGVCEISDKGDINPQECHDEADQSVGPGEEDSVENRQEPMDPVVEGLWDLPEEFGDECSTLSVDEEKGCSLVGLRFYWT